MSSPSARTDSVVRHHAERFLADSRAVGLSIGVYQGGAAHAYGFGVADLSTRAPATPATVYPIASLTKTFTGALLARAELEGRLRLDDDIRRHLDGPFPNLEFRGRPVTPRTLVTHTSRLPTSLPLPESFTRDDFLRALAGVTIDTFPGPVFRYSNAGVQLLGIVLERAYGRPYATLVDSLVAHPLGMTSTRLVTASSDRRQVATGYDEQRRAVPLPSASLGAAGGLTSSVDDMLRYLRWQVAERDDVARGTHHAVWGDTASWASKRSGYTMGYGWQMFRAANGGLRIFQDGAVPGYGAQCVFFPELDLGIVILSNAMDPTAPTRLSALVDSIAVQLDPRVPPGP
jgi:CubicO group peptidase (beta-lactamase class C family)